MFDRGFHTPKTMMIMQALQDGGVEIVQLEEFEAEPQYARNRDGSRGYAFASEEVFDRERFWQFIYLFLQGGPMWIDVVLFDNDTNVAHVIKPRVKRMELLSFDTIPTDSDHIRVTHDVDVVGIALDPGCVVLQEFLVINESDHALDFAAPHISHVADKTVIEARSEALFTWDGESRWCDQVALHFSPSFGSTGGSTTTSFMLLRDQRPPGSCQLENDQRVYEAPA